MPKTNTDHVVMEGSVFVCLHCGSRYGLNLPCPINVMTAAINAYVLDHKHCKQMEPK